MAPGFTSKSFSGGGEVRNETINEYRLQASDDPANKPVERTREQWIARYYLALKQGQVWDQPFGPFDVDECAKLRQELLPKDVLERGGE